MLSKIKVDDVIFHSKNRTEDLLVARNEIVSSYYYYYYSFFPYTFCAEDFSAITRSISFKFSVKMPCRLKFVPPEYFLEIHFRSEVIVILRFLKVNFV